MSAEHTPTVMVMVKRGNGDWTEMSGDEFIEQFTPNEMETA
ncbi:hypothetical protein ACH4YO_07875 [Streptomyces noursei]